MKMSIRKKVFLVATFFLVLGIACYAFLYPNKFHFITLGSWRIEAYKFNIENGILLTIVYALTSYCHIVFMTFYSILITDNLTTRAVVQWSLFWGVVDSAFEILQLKERSENSESYDFWLFNNINRYLENGHFDWGDLLFIWLGVVSVVYFWRVIHGRRIDSVRG